jgi:metallo-beta-lactamase family protein
MFVGYQSQGTVGSKILDGVDSVKLFGEDIAIKAEIVRIESFSSHADKNHLREWVKKAEPSARIFINHGEDEVTESLAMEAAKLTGIPAVAPYSGEVWDLIDGELVHKASPIPVIGKHADGGATYQRNKDYKTTPSTAKVIAAYEDLRRTGNSLMDLIDGSQGRSNKEVIALTRELKKLLEKYGR